MLELLQNQPGTTADQLAAELGVTERAARRYVGILREAEIPIISVRGRYGGYRVGRGVRLPPLVFTATEALGMVMAVLEGHHEAADSTDPVANALRKIMRALPEAVAAQAELVRRTARPVPDRYAAPADPSITAQLVHACSLRRLVLIGYRHEDGPQWSSLVEPWAVVVRLGRWYLLSRRVSNGAIRTYRLDRIHSVDAAGRHVRPARRPRPGGRPRAELRRRLGVRDRGGDRRPGGARWPAGSPAPSDASSRSTPRRCRLVGSTSDPAWYAEVLAAIPAPFRVVSGPELRDAVRALGERLIAAAEVAGT